MALQKVKDSMRTTTVLDATQLSGNISATQLTGAVPVASLSNVDLVEGTKGADIASAGTIVIGTDGGYFDITGTTGISTMTVAAGRVFTLQFDGVVTLTHSATLYLSGAANFTTEANDHMTFISVAANDVRQIGTGLKDGGSPIAAAGGKLLQMLSTTKTDTFSTASTSFVDVTGLTVSITPSATSSKIFVMAHIMRGISANSQSAMRIMRDSTAIGVGDAAGSRSRSLVGCYFGASDAGNHDGTIGGWYLDSPSSTSAIAYHVEVLAQSSTTTWVNRNNDYSDSANTSTGASTITVMEVAG